MHNPTSKEIEVKTQVFSTNFRTDNSPGSVRPDRSLSKNEELVGDAHSHPYPNHKYEGVAFSSGDISAMKDVLTEGYTAIVEAGTHRFALVITDSELAEKFFATHTDAQIDAIYMKAAKGLKVGSQQDRVRAGVQAVVGDGSKSGISFYQTTDKKKQKFKEVK